MRKLPSECADKEKGCQLTVPGTLRGYVADPHDARRVAINNGSNLGEAGKTELKAGRKMVSSSSGFSFHHYCHTDQRHNESETKTQF